MIHHFFGTTVQNPLRLLIANGQLDALAGGWPILGGGAIHVEGVSLALDDARYVYLDRDGKFLLSRDYLDYGRTLAGVEQGPYDLLAWHDGADWHIKSARFDRRRHLGR